MLSLIRLSLAVSLAGVFSSAFFSAAYCGWVGSRAVQRVGDPAARQRVAQQRVLLGGVEVLVDDVPGDAGRLVDVAERKVRRQAVEAAVASLETSAGCPCASPLRAGGIVIGGLQASRPIWRMK
jgi:hypothetical protein